MNAAKKASSRDFSLVTDDELRGLLLGSWITLNNGVLGRLTTRQVARLIEFELQGKRRPAILTRLHQRFTKLRAETERAVLLEAAEALRADPNLPTMPEVNNLVVTEKLNDASLRWLREEIT